jgi:hypothetical protein
VVVSKGSGYEDVGGACRKFILSSRERWWYVTEVEIRR